MCAQARKHLVLQPSCHGSGALGSSIAHTAIEAGSDTYAGQNRPVIRRVLWQRMDRSVREFPRHPWRLGWRRAVRGCTRHTICGSCTVWRQQLHGSAGSTVVLLAEILAVSVIGCLSHRQRLPCPRGLAVQALLCGNAVYPGADNYRPFPCTLEDVEGRWL